MTPGSTSAKLLALAVLGLLTFPAFAVAIPAPSSGDLVNAPKQFDGQTIEFEGEAIGEAMVRSDGVWLHLNDDAYMLKNVEEGAKLGGYNSGMPVWTTPELSAAITVFGDYKHEGDVVTVSGVYNAACRQHGGDMDIHAEKLAVAIPGHDAKDPIHPYKGLAALGLSIVAAGLWFADRRAGRLESIGHVHKR